MLYKESLNALLKVLRDQVEDIQKKLDGLSTDLPHMPQLKINPQNLYDVLSAMNTASDGLNNIMHDLEESK